MKNNAEVFLHLNDLMAAIKKQSFSKFDLVVGIANGGILPGYLTAKYLKVPFEIIYLKFRDEKHQQSYPEPQLIKPIQFEFKNKRILLVDDISNTGATLNKAQSFLQDSQIKTAAIFGKADYVFIGPHETCVKWPWE